MKNFRFMHTYKPYREGGVVKKRPMITTAMQLETDASGHPIGLAIGFAYCSKSDNPNKKVGRLIATGRVEKALECIAKLRTSLPRDQFPSENEYEASVASIAFSDRTRYGQHRTVLNANQEPVQTGHVVSAYIPVCTEEKHIKALTDKIDLPEDGDIRANIILALSNIQKFGSL